jgi:hypothetical protein
MRASQVRPRCEAETQRSDGLRRPKLTDVFDKQPKPFGEDRVAFLDRVINAA